MISVRAPQITSIYANKERKTFAVYYEQYFCRTLYMLCFSGAVLYTVNEWFSVQLNGFVVALLLLLASALVTIYSILRKSVLLYGVTGAMVCLILLLSVPLKWPIGQGIAEAVRWLLYSREPEQDFALTYAVISMGLVALCLCVGSYLLFWHRINRLCASGLLLLSFILFAVFSLSTNSMTVWFGCCFLLLALAELCVKQMRAVSFLAPFLLTGALLIAILPSSPQPLQWDFVKTIVAETGRLLTRIGDNLSLWFSGGTGEFGMSMSGFSESAFIGGQVAQSSKTAMLVKPLMQREDSLYLTGTIMNTFDGQQWIFTEKDSGALPAYQADLLETTLVLPRRLDLNENRTDYRLREVEITYADIYTKSLFHPIKSIRIRTDLQIERQQTVTFQKMQSKDASYRVSYLDINMQHPEIKKLLVQPVRQEAGLSLFEELKIGIPDTVDIEQQLLLHRQDIYANFLAVPEKEQTPKVKQLVAELTRGRDSNYDKMKAIEAFLQQYTYTTAPLPTTPDKSFLESFLFETQSGYCTYFATSMALMGRIVGIPTRYVQGFLLPYQQAEKEGGSTYLVSNNNAHAWVEAYMDGFGWVAFEPTAGYGAFRYETWEKAAAAPIAAPDIVVQKPEIEKPAEQETERKRQEERRGLFASFAAILGVLVLLVAGTLGIAALLAIRRHKRMYYSNIAEQQFMLDFKQILWLLQLLGQPLLAGETLRQYADRLNRGDFSAFVHIHEQVVYGKTKTVLSEELLSSSKLKEKLAVEAKKKVGNYRYLRKLLSAPQNLP